MRSRDTDPDAHRAQLAVYARMAPSEKVALCFELSRRAHEIAITGIRSRRSDLSHEQARHVLLRMLLGEELHRAAYPDAGLPET